MPVTLVLGGARSGKSRYAQHLALKRSTSPVYLATSRVWDRDHARRIERHRADRGPEWTTIEEERRLSRVGSSGRVVVVDCITLWLTNLFADAAGDTERAFEEAAAELDRALALENDWIFVSNEIGMAPHAMTEAGRKFVDLQGFANQMLASRAEDVILMVAGLPLAVRSGPGACPCCGARVTPHKDGGQPK